MILITNDAQLRSYVPNALVTVTGEMSLYDKMRADFALSEQWLTIHFVDASLLGKIALEKEHSEAANICCRAVVANALLRAIPSLDLVLTPNGFGIVSNQNVAPASVPVVSIWKKSIKGHKLTDIKADDTKVAYFAQSQDLNSSFLLIFVKKSLFLHFF